jgi:hypothetical protein
MSYSETTTNNNFGFLKGGYKYLLPNSNSNSNPTPKKKNVVKKSLDKNQYGGKKNTVNKKRVMKRLTMKKRKRNMNKKKMY